MLFYVYENENKELENWLNNKEELFTKITEFAKNKQLQSYLKQIVEDNDHNEFENISVIIDSRNENNVFFAKIPKKYSACYNSNRVYFDPFFTDGGALSINDIDSNASTRDSSTHKFYYIEYE